MNFLKKNYKLIIGIVIGAILISGISVYATGQYLASQVTYNNTNVASALDELYTKLSKYKNLNQTTTSTASDIVSGKTAYDNLGNLITGTAVIGNGLKDTISIPSNYTRRFFRL